MRKFEPTELLDENGNWITNHDYKEILRLDDMLNDAKIPHTLYELMDGWQICYPDKGFDSRICSIIEHMGSCGRDEDKLEIMGLLTSEEAENNSVAGYLTAEDVFERIKEHYERGE